MRRKNEHPNKIRNGRIRRDFKRLLELITGAKDASNDVYKDYEVFAIVEEIAENNALYFDDEGDVKELGAKE